MTFDAQVFRAFIASRSDLTEERDAASEVINDWNAQHAAAGGVVLLPVRWKPMPGRKAEPDPNRPSTTNS
ncbi:hypothetical protein FXB41_28015 [Bradyrhizobium canariense]|uniref:hypothetical protein n=1 Tax=Bradyrhizobium canariense TaxID=255045 RepID=UPI001CA50110|nr:hypothetical protein [Bradyrhizobium canariense]MBW5438469.1 hypothetical protein [Bradyrhizobium canariense]